MVYGNSPPGHKWHPEEVERLRVLFAGGLSGSQIGDCLGLTRNAIIGKLHRLGLNRGRKARATPWVAEGISERTYQRRKAGATQRPPQGHGGPVYRRKRWLGLNAGLEQAQVGNEATELPVAQDLTKAVTILELRGHHCRWPLGEPAADMLYCGMVRCGQFTSYCSSHHQQAHDRPSRYLRQMEWIASQ